MRKDFENQDVEFQRLMAEARFDRPAAPPYLTVKVLAHLEANQKRTRQLNWWRLVSLALVCLLASSAYLLLRQSSAPITAHIAQVDKPILVKIELAALEADAVEIVLPDGVSFFSESISSLTDQRSLQLELNDEFKGGKLPIVIRSHAQGLKSITIRFYSDANGIISERSLDIDFKKDDLS